MCECGFIVEDTGNNTYTSMPPNENEVERSIPFSITKNIDNETYKHYIYSFISEKMEMIYISSSHRYVAIYGFFFKVVKLTAVGAKFKTDGYTFLNKFKCLRIVYDKSNTCIFKSCFHQKAKKKWKVRMVEKIDFVFSLKMSGGLSDHQIFAGGHHLFQEFYNIPKGKFKGSSSWIPRFQHWNRELKLYVTSITIM